MYKSMMQGFLLLTATVVVIIFAYYVTSMIGKKMIKLSDGKYTQVLERTMIGLNISVTILKINRKIYVVAMQGKTIQLLDIVDEEDWKFLNNENEPRFNRKFSCDGSLINRLVSFDKIKENFNSKTNSWGGSDNNE